MAKNLLIGGLVALFAIGIYLWGHHDGSAGRTPQLVESSAEAEPLSPVKARPRDTYYPNSEDLAPNEMRVIACGTGMPTTRAFQAAACFLVELGNGDKFLFDAGSGSAERISSLQIPYNYLDKVFIGHLHTDHFGSLHDLFVAGAPAALAKSSAPRTRSTTWRRC